jgi:hypothetical protein
MAWVGLIRGGRRNVARDIALRVTAALCSSVGRMYVETGVDERHMLEHEGERISGWGEGALLRVVTLIVSMGWGVVRASFSAA